MFSIYFTLVTISINKLHFHKANTEDIVSWFSTGEKGMKMNIYTDANFAREKNRSGFKTESLTPVSAFPSPADIRRGTLHRVRRKRAASGKPAPTHTPSCYCLLDWQNWALPSMTAKMNSTYTACHWANPRTNPMSRSWDRIVFPQARMRKHFQNWFHPDLGIETR